MPTITPQLAQEYTQLGHRDTFGRTIIELGRRYPDIVVMTGDLSDATRVTAFGQEFPDRFFNVGIAEQNMMGVAGGLALGGKLPYCTTFSSFASLRGTEQVRNDLAYQYLPVKIIGIDAGVATGNLGATHFGLEDMGVLRAIPNMTIVSPSDCMCLMKLLWGTVEHPGPVYIRFSGGKPLDAIYTEDREFPLGQSVTLTEGTDVTLIATGLMVARALKAAEELKTVGINARVIDMYCIKPIDAEAIIRAAEETRLIVSIEEHSILGGLGSAVAEVLAEHGGAPRLIRMGLADAFCHIASHHELLRRNHLATEDIVKVVTEAMLSAA